MARRIVRSVSLTPEEAKQFNECAIRATQTKSITKYVKFLHQRFTSKQKSPDITLELVKLQNIKMVRARLFSVQQLLSMLLFVHADSDKLTNKLNEVMQDIERIETILSNDSKNLSDK